MTFQVRNLIEKNLNKKIKEIQSEIDRLELERDHYQSEIAKLKAKVWVDGLMKVLRGQDGKEQI